MAKNQQTETVENEVQQPETTDNSTEKLLDIEELRNKKQTSPSIFSGMCAAYGWKAGKAVTEEEYDAAVEAFSGSPIGKAVK